MVSKEESKEGRNRTYVIEQLNSHLDIRRMTCDNDQSLVCRSNSSLPSRLRPGLHNLNLTSAHTPNLVNLAPSFTDDTPHKVVWNEDLLGLCGYAGVGRGRHRKWRWTIGISAVSAHVWASAIANGTAAAAVGG